MTRKKEPEDPSRSYSEGKVTVHPSSSVHSRAILEPGVEIGPFCTVGENVRIGVGTRLLSHVVIDGHTVLGENNVIYPFTTIGMAPQDLKYRGEPSRTVIGSGNTIRESVTIHRGTEGGGMETVLGDNNLLMAYCHVAHDCRIGSRVVMANSANLAGHITIDDGAIIGGLSGIHQFVRVGRFAMVGDAPHELRQALEGSLNPKPEGMGKCGAARDPGVWFQGMGNAGLGPHHGAGAHFDVADHPDLAGQDDAVSELCRSRDPRLGDDDTVASGADIVRNLDKIVDLCPPADDGFPEGGPVDRHIGADFHIVFQDDGSGLRDLDPSTLRPLGKAEAVRADDRAALDDHPVAQAHPVQKGDPGIEDTVLADLRSRSDDASRKKEGSSPDFSLRFHDTARPDFDTVSDPCAGINDGMRGDSGLGRGQGKEVLEKDRHGQVGRGHDNLGNGGFGENLGNEDPPGLDMGNGLSVLGVGKKGQVLGTGFIHRADGTDLERSVRPDQRSSDLGGNLGEGDQRDSLPARAGSLRLLPRMLVDVFDDRLSDVRIGLYVEISRGLKGRRIGPEGNPKRVLGDDHREVELLPEAVRSFGHGIQKLPELDEALRGNFRLNLLLTLLEVLDLLLELKLLGSQCVLADHSHLLADLALLVLKGLLFRLHLGDATIGIAFEVGLNGFSQVGFLKDLLDVHDSNPLLGQGGRGSQCHEGGGEKEGRSRPGKLEACHSISLCVSLSICTSS